MKIPGKFKEVGNLDFSEGKQKRFICYCPHCSQKILWTRQEMLSILRQLQKKCLFDSKLSLVRIGKEGIFRIIKSLKYKRIKLIDNRDYLAPRRA